MNMNNPSTADLAILLSQRPDLGGGHHRCVVYPNGDVEIIDSTGPKPPGGMFWLETWSRSNKYVGVEAASDARWVGYLYEWLVALWNAGSKGHSDEHPTLGPWQP